MKVGRKMEKVEKRTGRKKTKEAEVEAGRVPGAFQSPLVTVMTLPDADDVFMEHTWPYCVLTSSLKPSQPIFKSSYGSLPPPLPHPPPAEVKPDFLCLPG